MQIIIDYLEPQNTTHTSFYPNWIIDTSYSIKIKYGD
jgi:hypothetical protein